MKVFLAGATGALGRRLVPLLVSSGHHVFGMTRRSANAASLQAAGAEPIVSDVLDREAVLRAVEQTRPEAVVHQVTALANVHDLKNFDREFDLTNRLRTEGTEHLLAAAQAVGAARFLAQSYTGWPNARTGDRVKSENDPLDPTPPRTMRRTLDAIRRLEQLVTGAAGLTGIVLRYGSFYGPGTSISEAGDIVEAVRRRRLPVVGAGTGVWSFIHIDDAAAATLLALQKAPPGIYNIVDDEPAEVSVWLPELARAVGAKVPYRVPGWLGRMIIGEAGASMMTEVRGSSNAKARRVLGWRPAYPSWRQGFERGLSGLPPAAHGGYGQG